MLNVFSLFSGIGAFEKALDRVNVPYSLINYCEVDKYASKSYSLLHNTPETMNLGDITKVDLTSLKEGQADLITYGFPCQDISLAGKQAGFEKDGQLTRSGLFFYASAIIGRIKPKVAICENVKNLTSKKFEKEFKIVLDSLEELGYNNYWKVLNAKDYGIPQNRERVFIVSIRKDVDNKEFTFPESFPLELRLKDMLEKEVDEKYYLSEKAISGFNRHAERHKDRGNGFGWKPTDGDVVANTLLASANCRPSDNYIKCVQVGQLYGTEKEPNPQAGRIYSADGISPTMDTCSGGNRMPKVLIPQATKQGYAEAREGDGVYINRPHQKRGVVQKDMIQTIKCTSNDIGVVEKDLRIRKLTPKECWRLMGFDDADVDKCIDGGISNTQLYKQAGNSIVVDVIEEIYCALFNSVKGLI